VLDPNALTLGSRRFAEYKRPNLLLHDTNRLERLLLDAQRPVQLIVAGKAHPNDDWGKALVRSMARFAHQPELAQCIVFLEDYDMVLAQHLAAGIDVWLNTPRRPSEACGTSGMKMLFNGGLNFRCSTVGGRRLVT
jgi:starch phosphorylase